MSEYVYLTTGFVAAYLCSCTDTKRYDIHKRYPELCEMNKCI